MNRAIYSLEGVLRADTQRVTERVWSAIDSWVYAFSVGSATGAAGHYEKSAFMVARPFGEYQGRDQIRSFWTQLIEEGLREMKYIDPKLTVISRTSARMQATRQMNAAREVITNELWVLQPNGAALLREDYFEVMK